jgi:hypothetical protein
VTTASEAINEANLGMASLPVFLALRDKPHTFNGIPCGERKYVLSALLPLWEKLARIDRCEPDEGVCLRR